MNPRAEPRLRIDAEAAVQRLSAGELEGPWQLPAELARRAFRAGATRVRVACERRGFLVHDDGPPLDAGTLEALARARRADEDALARLESGPHAELRFLAALPGATVDLAGRSGVALRVAGLRWDAERARDWLRSVGRFAGRHLELDGDAVAPHAWGGIAREPLRGPWPGELSLTASGDDAAIWLVSDRIVSAFLTAPGAFPYEAMVDVSAAGPRRSAAALRETITPLVPALIEQAVGLALDLSRRPRALDAHAAARMRALLLKAARLPRWRGDALRAPVYPARAAIGTGRLSLVDLGSLEVCGPDRRVPTCVPASVPVSLFLAPTPAAILEPAERSRLSQELGLRFRTLPRVEDGPPPRASWPARARRWCASAWFLGRPLDDAELEPAERRLLDALRADGGIDVRLRSGRGAVRAREGRIVLPRAHPAVRDAVAAVARDPAWTFAAAAALLGRLVGKGARSRWREAIAGTLPPSLEGGLEPRA